MKAKLVLAVVVLCLAAADDKKDQDKLQGTWVTVTAVQGGKKLDPAADKNYPRKIVFEGDKVSVHLQEAEHKGSFKLGMEGQVATIDLIPADPMKQDRVMKGIYKLEGDTLTICVDEDREAGRPKDFVSKDGSRQILVTFKREKK